MFDDVISFFLYNFGGKYTNNGRDLWERITQSNKNDIIGFHHALMDKTYEQSKEENIIYINGRKYIREKPSQGASW